MKQKTRRSAARRFAALLLTLALTAGLAACGASPSQPTPAAPTPASVTMAPTRPVAEQRRILEANRERWAFPEGEGFFEPWFYTFTDLDHNGRMEVLAASTQGSGIYTYANFYEVDADFSGVRNLYHADVEIEGPDDWPEIILDSLPCYHDSASDTYYYACEGILRDGAAHYNSSWALLSLKDGVADWEYLGSMDTQYTDEEAYPTVSCSDAAGNPISEQDYNALVERRCAGMEKSELRLNWTAISPPEMTPPPEAAETAAAAATPEPTAAGPQVVITKNPSSESLAIGGKTWFIAHASNAESLTWELLNPQGTPYSLADAMAANPGLKLEALEGDTLAVSNVPRSADGWSVRARFDGQGTSAYTEPATLYVGDYVNLYASVIQAYKAAYETGNSQNLEYLWNNDLSEMTAYSSGVGYALKDLDKDGTPELLIAGLGTEDFSEGMVYALYTLYNGVPAQLAVSQARNRWYLRSDNLMYNEASGGAANSYFSLYRKTGTELSGIRNVFTWPDGDTGVSYYYQEGTVAFEPVQGDVKLSEAEFNAKRQELRGTIFVPPLTKIA